MTKALNMLGKRQATHLMRRICHLMGLICHLMGRICHLMGGMCDMDSVAVSSLYERLWQGRYEQVG